MTHSPTIMTPRPTSAKRSSIQPFFHRAGRRFWLLGIGLFFLPQEARVSGPYIQSFAENDFLLSHTDTSYKIFRSPEDSHHWFVDKDKRVQREVAHNLPDLESLVLELKSAGALAPYNPFLAVFPLDTGEEVAELGTEAFPLTVSFRVSPSENPQRRLEVSLAKPVPTVAMTSLVRSASAFPWALPPAEAEEVPPPYALPRPGTRTGVLVGYYVGAGVMARTETRARLEKMCAERVDRVFETLEPRWGTPSQLTAITKITTPLPLKKKLGSDFPASRYNPNGPLLDDCWRARAERGRGLAVLLFTPDKARDHEQPPEEVNQRLSRALADPGELAHEKEMVYFQARFGKRSHQSNALYALESDKSPRCAALLEFLILGKSTDRSVQQKAAEMLRGIDSPRRKSAFLLVAQKQTPPALLREAAEGLEHYPEEPVIDALLGVWNNKSLTWNQRYPARDTLKKFIAAARLSPALIDRIKNGIRD